MIVSNQFLFLTSLLHLIVGLRNEETKEISLIGERKIWTAFHGSVGRFRQNLTGYPDNVNATLWMSLLSETVLNFDEIRASIKLKIYVAMGPVEPFILARHLENNTFLLWGPIYSLVVETAARLNKSIEACYLDGQDEKMALFIFKPDLMLVPMAPGASDLFDSVLKEDVAQTAFLDALLPPGERSLGSRSPGSMALNCIAFRKRWPPGGVFVAVLGLLVRLVDKYVATATATSIISVSAILAFRNRTQFWSYLGVTLGVLFNLAPPGDRPVRFPYLLLAMATTIWILQQFFGGDLYSLMSARIRPILVDSWSDLAADKSLKIAAVSDRADPNNPMRMFYQNKSIKEEFFNPELQNYDDFTGRLDLIGQIAYQTGGNNFSVHKQTFDVETLKVEKLSKVRTPDGDTEDVVEAVDGDIVLMHQCDCLRYRVSHGPWSNVTHVSVSGGDIVPYFIPKYIFTNPEDMPAFNEVILRMTESGIYQKWLRTATYDLKENFLKDPLFEFSVGKVSHFYGMLAIGFICYIFAFVVLVFENVGRIHELFTQLRTTLLISLILFRELVVLLFHTCKE